MDLELKSSNKYKTKQWQNTFSATRSSCATSTNGRFPRGLTALGPGRLPWRCSCHYCLLFLIKIHGLGNGIHSCAGQLWADRALWAGSQNLPQHQRQSNGDLSSLRSTDKHKTWEGPLIINTIFHKISRLICCDRSKQ